MMSIGASIWFFPDFTELVKIYIISVVVVVTVIINILFRLQMLRKMIVEMIVQDVLRDPDIQKIIDWRLRRAEFQKRVKEILRERNERKAE